MADIVGAWKTKEEIEQENNQKEEEKRREELMPTLTERIETLEQAILFLTME